MVTLYAMATITMDTHFMAKTIIVLHNATRAILTQLHAVAQLVDGTCQPIQPSLYSQVALS